MSKGTIFLFGAAEKGTLCHPFSLHCVEELLDQLGEPPEESEGIHYAIQALLFKRGLIYFRVTEEGYSWDDYMMGLNWLKKTPLPSHVSAICLPGTSDQEIIQKTTAVCHKHQSMLIVSEKDLYDYLTVK